jgi:hypothetical protein
MALEDRGAQHDKEVVDKYIDPGASVEMSTRDYVVRPSALTASMVIVLPPVAEAKGRFYSILVRACTAPFNITISDRDDSECWDDIVLDSKCDRLLMYSDGLFWHPLAAITNEFTYGYDHAAIQ